MTLTWTDNTSNVQHTYATNWVPITTETKTFDSGSFTKLLESKVREAQVKIQENLEHQLLYGNSWATQPAWATQPVKAEAMRNEELRRCIADAYDKHIKTGIMNESPVMEALKKEKKADMETAVIDAMNKRKEARANLVLDFLDANWGEPEFGETHTWEAIFDTTPDKTYRYAAIFCDNGRWYRTYDKNGYTHEELKAHIADICIRAEVYFNGQLVA